MSELESSELTANKRKRKSRPGFLTGMCAGVFLSILLLIGCFVALHFWAEKQRQEMAAAATQVEVTLSKKIGTKLDILLKEIDANFLFEYDKKKVEDGIYKSLFASLDDKYAEYYTAEEYRALMEKMSGAFYGIGVVMQMSEDESHAEVISLVETGGAKEAGVLPGDWLCEADGTSLLGCSLTEIVAIVRGEEGTTAHIKVYRPSEEKYYEFDVERRRIESNTVYSEMVETEVGYIQISEFDIVTDEQFRTELEKLQAEGMKRLIIDLRNNPGGTIESVVSIADMLLPEGIVTYTETKDGTRTEYRSENEPIYNGPLVVLINENSASASEILSGAIKDYGRGTLVGQKTYGKGIVQSVRMLTDGTAVKMTVSRYFTPNGTCIHEIGIEPDISEELAEEAIVDGLLEKDEDTQLHRALEALEQAE